MTSSGVTALTLAEVGFNRRDHEHRPLRPMPPGRDYFADRWQQSREFLFGSWIDVDREVEPSAFTAARDDMFWQADEHIIPVVDLFRREGSKVVRPLFERALTHGIDSVADAPPELTDFFAHVDQVPDWFDRRSAERGRVLASSASLSAIRVVVGWALFETAMTNDISAATGATGRFRTDAVRRYVETFRMFALALKPDIYERDSEVFQTVLRVRLMHALASRGLRQAWGDEHYLEFGEPIAATSLLGFGNGPLLTRLVDHRLGRKLSSSDLDDIAMFAGWFGHLIGAPARLRPRDGQEMVRSLNYIVSRGGDPSGWRRELLDTGKQPFEALAATYLPWMPSIGHRAIVAAGTRAIAIGAGAPLVPVFGLDQVEAFMAGADAYRVRYRIHGQLFARAARLNAVATGMRDRLPGMGLLRRRIYRNGPPGIDQAVNAMSAFAKRYHDIAMAYTHHDDSASTNEFGPPRTERRLRPAG